MQTPLPIPGPLSLGDLLDRAFRLYRANFRTLVLITAIFYVPYAIISGLLTGQGFSSYMDAVESFASIDTAPENISTILLNGVAPFFGITLLLSFFAIIMAGFISLMLTTQHLARLRNEQLTVGESFRLARQRFWPWLAMAITRTLGLGAAGTISMVFVICGMAGVFSIGGAGFGSLFLNGDPEPWAVGVAIVGGIVLLLIFYVVLIAVFLLPIGYLFARWVAAVPGLVDERWGAIESLRRSWQLTRGRSWRAFGYIALLYALNFFVISIPQGVFQQVLSLVFLDNVGLVFGLSTALGSFFAVLWQPLLTAAIVLLYFDLRVRSESYDLEMRVQQMEQSLQPVDVASPSDAHAV